MSRNATTIAEIRAAKADAETEVLQALKRFQVRTGLAITGCEVHNITAHQFDQPRARVFVSTVRLTAEEI